jgi:poly(3-hydroxybutyrate) depolymerase
MYGTDDTVMPYQSPKSTHSNAAQFKNNKARDAYDSHGSFWAKRHGFADDHAYMADIPCYWQTWAEKVNGDDTKPTVRALTAQSKLYIYSASGHLPLQHIAVEGGGHDWFGHLSKSPRASSPASLQVDATQIVADFFRIPLKGYQAPVVTPKLPHDSAAK